ncbi:Beta-galactosidase [[Actinomadura] parvosata subsp. kistnae]|uniref:Beta-galactosidase n=1 Tax=[Actinomadura] parvosata subsp. kistnae TaxID=1909395 RepID=A0A1U9ZT16_9ACTN|nr:beta-galactosidase [Nonomuraea sp. ATCC 55076]AQZ61088.1 beta-galactosidase [Nonomuraea sp. ATCC 55076]SPL87540.1 Beta-galactosidase [Actinomadura parvosata subsp. kistnae]
MYPERPAGIAYGGDYNPEQWPREVLEEDVALMREAGVNLVTLGLFSWALMEPEEGRFAFGWLDEIIDRLHANGVAVDLGTPTAAPPAWFVARHPDVLPVTREGVRIGFGGRQSACSSAPAFREATARLVRALGEHYRGHPAVVMWHVHNEYGAPLGECYCEHSVAAWRAWLRQKYRDISALNDAWGTTFWGQTYTDWAEIDAPRANHTTVNPAQRLDYARFSDGQHREHYALQRDILRELTPGLPVTTNFAGTVNCKSTDLWQWARELDVIANDHYLQAERPDNHIDLAMSADLARSVAGGRPWMLMEHSAGAVNWQPRNLAKRPGEMRRNSLAHVARGSDSVLFFQFRASRFGAEKFHSGMVPHAGTGSEQWREIVRLGADLRKLAGLRGSRVRAEVALVWDWESYWALELDWRPSVDLTFRERMDAFYEALWREHVTVDFVHPSADISGYRVVVAPSSYLLTEASAKNLHRYVEAGGHLLVSYFSGIVDEHDTIHPGAHPGALRELLGLSIEEFHPLREHETVTLTTGDPARVWSERVRPAGAVTVEGFADGPDAGHPALTRHDLGAGSAWYLATAPVTGLRDLLARVLDHAGVSRPRGLPDTLELVRRGGHVFLINHGDRPVTAEGVSGVSVFDGVRHDGPVTVPAGAVTVLLETPRP